MRWIVKDSERKPDPEPMKGTAKKAVYVAMALFAISFIVIVVFYDSIQSPNKVWYPYTALVALVLGVFALFKVGDR
jgi:cell division protein FtsW (lipid II flippase)